MKKYITIGFGILFCACSNYLDYKPDIKMVVPKSLKDAELLLNDYTALNEGYPIYGELGTDDYYLPDANWEGVTDIDQRNTYIWADQPYRNVIQWQRPYKVVYLANQVIDILSKLDRNNEPEKYNRTLGAAHFYRAFAFQQLLEVFAPAYVPSTAASEMGIPIRLDPGIDGKSTRASVEACYQQILSDYLVAANNLIVNEYIVGRPNKAAAYAGMARAYLNMGDFPKAFLNAEEGLKLKNQLMDFNQLNPNVTFPIQRFNVEVLFPATTTVSAGMNYNNGLVDSLLIKSYTTGDLRKTVFFQESDDLAGAFAFRGSFQGTSSSLFTGFTTSELYLIKAEAGVRANKIPESLLAINTLLRSRWDKNLTYTNVVVTNPDVLLPLILQERRKELVFRGRRWSDLKRLNQDRRFQKTLIRKIKGVEYQLLPNSLLYAYRLPEIVIEQAEIPQNKR